jgi:uncharacterized protein (DUF2249 family)
LISRKAADRDCHHNGVRATGPRSVIRTMNVVLKTAPDTDQALRVFDARSVSRRSRHEIVYDALEQLPEGGTLRYIGLHYPIGLMEQLVHRYGRRLTHRFVEIGVDRVVIDLTLD